MIKYIYITSDPQIVKQLRFINNSFTQMSADQLLYSCDPITHGIFVIQHPDSAMVKAIREKSSLVRIIYIQSSSDEELDENLLLSQLSGYLRLPLDMDELYRAYTRAIDEMSAFSRNSLYRLSNNYYWDRVSRRLYDNRAVEVKLTLSQAKLLEFFIKKPNHPISEAQLASDLYNEGINLKTASLKNTISALRKKLEGIELENIYGQGYRLNVSLGGTTLSIINLNSLLEEIKNASSLQHLYKTTCERLFQLYHSQRAFITKQHEEKLYVQVLYEVADPKYPGAYSLNQKVPVKKAHKKMLQLADSISDPVTFSEKELLEIAEEDKEFWRQIPIAKSMLFYNFTHKGSVYSIGVHQVSYDRVWSMEEKIFLKNITKALCTKLKMF